MNSIPSKNSPRNKRGTQRNKHRRKLAIAVLVGVTAALVVWTGPGQIGSSQGLPYAEKATLEVRIKDHREAISDFSKLEIIIDTIRISPKAGLKFWQIGWRELKPSLKKIDLTKYTGRRSAMIFRGEVRPGSFDAIHLKLKGIEGKLKRNKNKVPVKNLVGPIKLGFSIRPKNETLVILDLVVLDMSDHPPRSYEFHIKGYELYTNGKLVDKIPPG